MCVRIIPFLFHDDLIVDSGEGKDIVEYIAIENYFSILSIHRRSGIKEASQTSTNEVL